MNLTDFEGRYGATERRRYLIGLLKNEMDAIAARGWVCRAYVFGSLVVSDKAEPGDIDVLLCIGKPFGSAFWRQITAGNDIAIKPCQITARFDPDARTPPPLPPCHDVDVMVRLFNESTKNTEENIEISVEQCVEVSL